MGVASRIPKRPQRAENPLGVDGAFSNAPNVAGTIMMGVVVVDVAAPSADPVRARADCGNRVELVPGGGVHIDVGGLGGNKEEAAGGPNPDKGSVAPMRVQRLQRELGRTGTVDEAAKRHGGSRGTDESKCPNNGASEGVSRG